jgi:MoaA/NifB/PqqE/SkfB family radical SAM enzyme
MIPRYVTNALRNVALHALGRRDEAARYPLASCFLVTYRCDLACGYCLENTRHRGSAELDTAGVVAVLEGIRGCCDVIDLSGGEPALRADLPELLAACRRLGFREIVLNSNGVHLAAWDDLSSLRHVHRVVLGVDSLTADGFHAITGGSLAQHRAQLAALERLHALQRELGFDLALCSVMLADHLDELEPILEWCYARDVMLSVSPHIDAGLRVEQRLRADPRYRALAGRLLRDREAGRPLFGSPSYYRGLRDLGPHVCVPMANLTVSPRGEMFWPCGELQLRGPRFGEGRSLREMVDAARAEHGPAPACRDRCHFSCRLAFSTLVTAPWELPGEALHMLRHRRFAR